jgi:hypothetical protein
VQFAEARPHLVDEETELLGYLITGSAMLGGFGHRGETSTGSMMMR